MSSSPWERDEVAEVLRRLTERFPEVPSEIVEVMVHRVHAEFDGPIRDFVPLLVEKAARGRLIEMQKRLSTA